jgi:hypothetical protein
MQLLGIMKISWTTSPLALVVAQKFLSPETWVPFFSFISFVLGERAVPSIQRNVTDEACRNVRQHQGQEAAGRRTGQSCRKEGCRGEVPLSSSLQQRGKGKVEECYNDTDAKDTLLALLTATGVIDPNVHDDVMLVSVHFEDPLFCSCEDRLGSPPCQPPTDVQTLDEPDQQEEHYHYRA